MPLPPALRRPAFRSLWAAGLVTDAGDWLLLIALPIAVYARTGSALGTAAAFLAQLAPAIVLAPLAGRLADGRDRRGLLLALTGLQALSLTPLLLGDAAGRLGVLYGVIVAQSALQALFDPAERALLPACVAPGELVSANGLVALGEGVARLAGGPLGGVLLAVAGLRGVAVADLASYAVAGALIARAAVPAAPPRAAGTPAPSRAFRAVLRRPPLRHALALSGGAAVAQGIFLVLFVVFVARRLGGGAGETGLLRGVQAIGAIGAALVLATTARRVSPPHLMAYAALAFGAVSLLIWNLPAVTTAPLLYAVLFATAGAPAVAMVTGLTSYLQAAAPDAERGRAFGALGLADNLGEALGMVLAGALTAAVGLDALLDLEGALYVLLGLAAVPWLARAGTRRAPCEPRLTTSL